MELGYEIVSARRQEVAHVDAKKSLLSQGWNFMREADHKYTPPDVSSRTLPAAVAHYLNGANLLEKTQALRLSTIDPEGWPHAALLSAGDIVVMPSGHIRFVLFPQSGTVANLERDGRLTLTLSLDGGMCELRMRARRLNHSSKEVPLAFFEAEVEAVRRHAAPYAEVTGGITFALHEPDAVLPRWRRQIEALRTAA